MSRGIENNRRRLQFAFAAFCVVAAALVGMRHETSFPTIKTAAWVGYLLAAAFVTAAVLWNARRTLVGFHLLFVPVQFLFSFGGGIAPLGGLVFGTVVATLMKPRFPQMGRRARRVWLTLHVGISVGWLGLSLAMTTLAIAGATTNSHPLRHGAYELMHIFDRAIVIPSVVLAIITGLVVSLGTPWGVLKHWWVLLKLVIALAIPAIAMVESTWIEELQTRTAHPSGDPGGLGLALVICMLCYAVLLWTAVALSVFKPGGKTRWNRTPSHRTSKDRARHRAKREPANART